MKAAIARSRTPPSFRFLLQAELARRCAENPQYSLRAFARRLNVSHATLSQMIRGERPITARTIQRLGAALGLDAAAIDACCTAEPASASVPRHDVAELARDAAEVVSDWYHFAILELTHVESFRPDVRWIARVLGITTDEVNAALSRLLRLGLLEMRSAAEWVDLSGDAVAHFEDFTRAAVEQLLERLRRLTADSIARGDRRHRSHGVTTLAIDSRKLPQAIAAIERFRGELADLLSGEPADCLAQLEVHLYPITPATKDPS